MSETATREVAWRVLEHGPLEQLDDNLWEVDGAVPRMPLRRRMLVARLPEGRLLIHNAVAVNDAVRAEIEALGEPAYQIVPSGYHRIDAPKYKRRYPNIQIYCPAGALDRVKERVEVDGTYDDFPSIEGVALRHLEGTKRREGVMTVTTGTGKTLVFNDLVMNLPNRWGLFWTAYRMLGSTGKPRTTLIGKMFIVDSKKELRADFEKLAGTEGLNRIIPGHGARIEDSAAEILKRIAADL